MQNKSCTIWPEKEIPKTILSKIYRFGSFSHVLSAGFSKSLLALSCNVVLSQWCPSSDWRMWRGHIHLALSVCFSVFLWVCLYFCLALSSSLPVSSSQPLLITVHDERADKAALPALFFLSTISHLFLSFKDAFETKKKAAFKSCIMIEIWMQQCFLFIYPS